LSFHGNFADNGLAGFAVAAGRLFSAACVAAIAFSSSSRSDYWGRLFGGNA
jgi:hypothetical protein